MRKHFNAGSHQSDRANVPGTVDLASSDGKVAAGSILTATVTDSDGFNDVTYVWKAKAADGRWTKIDGANAASLTIDDTLAGHEIKVVARYVDAEGHRERHADKFGVVPDDAPAGGGAANGDSTNHKGTVDLISRDAEPTVGSVLKARVTDADGHGQVSYAWMAKGSDGQWDTIEGATGARLTVDDTIAGHAVKVKASYVDAAGHHETHTTQIATKSRGTGTHDTTNEAGHVDLASSTTVATVGSVLTATVTDGDGVGQLSYAWQMQHDDGRWSTIQGATESSLTVDDALAGHAVKVQVRYVDAEGHRERHADTIDTQAADSGGTTGGSAGDGGSGGTTAPTTGSGTGGTGTGSTPTQPPTDPVTPVPTGDGKLDIGINLAGAEFGDHSLPGVYDRDYTYPTAANIDYYADHGFDSIRVPFKWERLQPTMNGELSDAELARLDKVVAHATERGLEVNLDLHNYGKGYGGLVGQGTPDSAFADFWGKLAGHYKDNPNVVFGLMNEPHSQTAESWIKSVNAAVDAIRDAGATQKINVPGTYWDGAWSWVSSDNDTVIGAGVKDPLNNYRFEVHQYLDSDGSGTHAEVVSENVGVERLAAITEWAEQTGHKLYLGEFGVAQDAKSLAALDNMLGFMQQHQDVWEGASYWAGGPWWGDYMYSSEPVNGVEKPQMEVLTQYA